MSYAAGSDFLALLRNTANGERVLSMPGLDYVVSALQRAGLITLSIGQTAPIANQTTTVWFQPATQSWASEGTVFLWNTTVSAYQPATPALWAALIVTANGGDIFQSVGTAAAAVATATTILAIQRAGPVATALTLPSVLTRPGRILRLADWSTSVVNHAISLTPATGQTIMQQATWNVFSTPDQPGGIALYPSVDLNGWIIAP